MREKDIITVAEAKAYYIIMGLVKVLETAVQERDYETLDFIANELQNIILEVITRRRCNDEME